MRDKITSTWEGYMGCQACTSRVSWHWREFGVYFPLSGRPLSVLPTLSIGSPGPIHHLVIKPFSDPPNLARTSALCCRHSCPLLLPSWVYLYGFWSCFSLRRAPSLTSDPQWTRSMAVAHSEGLGSMRKMLDSFCRKVWLWLTLLLLQEFERN